MEIDLDSSIPQETWERARYYQAAIGHVPSLFSSCIRAIGKVEAILFPVDTPSVRELAVASAEFLVRTSPTLKSIFYWAGSALYPETRESHDPQDVEDLLLPFLPGEIAAIIGTTYLYRRCQKLSPHGEWLRIGRKVTVQAALGHLIGQHMDLVGPGTGMLLGAIRPLSMTTFAIRTPERFQSFRRARRESTLDDLELEQEHFGCTHLHVASLVVQSLGFCMPRSSLSMSFGLDALNLRNDALPSKMRGQLLSFRAASAAIDQAVTSGEFVASTADYQLVLPAEVETAVRSAVEAAVRSGGFLWLSKRASDLPEAVRAALEGAAVDLED